MLYTQKKVHRLFDTSQIPLNFSKYAKDTKKINENKTNDRSSTKH